MGHPFFFAVNPFFSALFRFKRLCAKVAIVEVSPRRTSLAPR